MSKKPTRQPVSKKTRFEVFKRDSFTCQYCGAKAPEVVLHADHINPVANGGDSGIMNLVTACAACNGGKGARKLDDRSAVERQRAQIEEIQARREQLEMMLQWRDAAQAEALDTVEELARRVAERGGDLWPNESGKRNLRRWLKRFSIQELLEALDESFDAYMKFNGDEPDGDAWEIAFKKIPAIASLRRQAKERPYVVKLAYVQAILRRRLNDPRGNYIRLMEEAVSEQGLDPGVLEDCAKECSSWDDFCALVKKRWRSSEAPQPVPTGPDEAEYYLAKERAAAEAAYWAEEPTPSKSKPLSYGKMMRPADYDDGYDD